MNNLVNKHINTIVSNTNLNKFQKCELKEYLTLNFNERYNEFISKNISHDDAMKQSLELLGTSKDFYDFTSNTNKLILIISKIMLILLIMYSIILNFTTIMSRLPFNFYNIFHTIIPFTNLQLLIDFYFGNTQVAIIRSFIFLLIGFFAPIAFNKINNFKYNLKVLFYIVSILEISKLFCFAGAHINFVIINTIICLLGYLIFIILLNLIYFIKSRS